MNGLPTEILRFIFSLLIPRDQLECVTVCRQWNHANHHHSLIRAIYIYRLQHLNRLMSKVKEEPVLGAKVETLKLELDDFGVDFSTIFFSHFPNVRNISLKYHHLSFNAEPYPNHPWCERIETIEEYKSDFFTKTLLFSGQCNNLTFISLTGSNLEPARSLIEGLTNAPALKTLRLKRYVVSFLDLELLHETVPLLDSLFLKKVELRPIPNLHDIKPATSLKRLRCISCDYKLIGAFNPHILYFSQKYTHIEELDFELQPLFSDEDDEIDLLVLYHKLILKSYLKTLGPRLKSFSIHLDCMIGARSLSGFEFELLDECGCQVESLSLKSQLFNQTLRTLAKTNQAQYIQSLTIGTLYEDICNSQSFEWLTDFKAIKELELHFDHNMIFTDRHTQKLSDILMHLRGNQLEALRLYHLRLIPDDLNMPHKIPSLKHLTLSDIYFKPGVGECISRQFPNLKHLRLEEYRVPKKSLNLPNMNLSYLEIVHRWQTRSSAVALITEGNGQRRLYNTRVKPFHFGADQDHLQKDVFTLPPITSQPLDESRHKPKLKITCKSVQNFVLLNSKN